MGGVGGPPALTLWSVCGVVCVWWVGGPPALTLWGVCGVCGWWVGSGVCVCEVVWCVCVCVGGGVAWVKHNKASYT